MKRRSIVFIVLLTVVWGYAAFKQGGVWSRDWNESLLALGLIAMGFWGSTPRADLAPPLDPWLRWPLLLLPCYGAFQLIPLPFSLLGIVSPARVDQIKALAPLDLVAGSAPLSVTPSATLSQLLGICGFTVVFLLVRELSWHESKRPWVLVAPIIVLGGLEAMLGIMQYGLSEPGTGAHGTYFNRDHFAGLLEMILPFAVMYPVATLRQAQSRRHFPALPVLKACVVLGVATVIFVGIIYSLSRMGFVAALCSLFVMGAAEIAGISYHPAVNKDTRLSMKPSEGTGPTKAQGVESYSRASARPTRRPGEGSGHTRAPGGGTRPIKVGGISRSMHYSATGALHGKSLLQSSRAISSAWSGVGLPTRKKWVAVGLVGVLVLLSFVFLPPDQLIGRFAELGSSEGISANDRLIMWKETLPLIAAYPLFGCGLGGYESAFHKFNVSSPNWTVDYAHNDYLQFLAELGGAGFLILAALMLVILLKAVRAISQHPRSDGRCLALACAGAMVAILIHSLVDFNLHIEASALLLAWISGVAVGVRETAEPQRREGREAGSIRMQKPEARSQKSESRIQKSEVGSKIIERKSGGGGDRCPERRPGVSKI